MSKPVLIACPKCGGHVAVLTSVGGRGTNDLTSYSADCDICGKLVDHLSGDGRRDTAVREYNRWARSYTAPTVSHSVTVRAGYGGYNGGTAGGAAVGAELVAPTPVMVRETPKHGAAVVLKPATVPVEHQSKSAPLVRHLAMNAFKTGSKEQKMLLDIVAEIDASEQAYADLVEMNRVLREKIERYERNLV